MNIFVTGPHRAGTTFVAKCFAHAYEGDGVHFYPEEAIDFGKAYLIESLLSPFVLQCPFLAAFIHSIPAMRLGHVVWCDRADDEILASHDKMYGADGHRLRWEDTEQLVRKQYWALDDGRPLLDIQRENWQLQKKRLTSWQEVDYHFFDKHPLHVDNEARSHWMFRSTGEKVKEHLPPDDDRIEVRV